MKRKRAETSLDDDDDRNESKKTRTENNSVKVLICGSVNGHLAYFYSILSSLQRTHGPFVGVFCVGTFLVESNMNEMDKEYIFGNKKAPITTYVADSGESSKFFQAIPNGGELKNNIYFFGRACCLRDINGLRVTSLSGEFEKDLKETSSVEKFGGADLERVLNSQNVNNIDLFLSPKLPSQIFNHLMEQDLPRSPFRHDEPVKKKSTEKTEENEEEEEEEENEEEIKPLSHFSNEVRLLAMKFRPRYHFTSIDPSQYYERVPYEHGGIVTRFIHLRDIPYEPKTTTTTTTETETNEEQEIPVKFKYFCYGLDIIPFQFCTTKHLASVTPKYFSPSPFIITSPHFPPPPQQHQQLPNRLMVRKPPSSRHNLPPVSNHHQQQQYNNRPPPTPFDPKLQCWFCLSNPNVETNLILDIGKKCYLALSKGSIIGMNNEVNEKEEEEEWHILIIPIRHVAHYHFLTSEEKKEIEDYQNMLLSIFSKERDYNCLIYDRTILTRRGAHSFINFLAFSNSLRREKNEIITIERIKKEIEIQARDDEISETVQKFEGDEHKLMKKELILSNVQKNSSYVYFQFIDGSKMMYVARQKRIDINFVRKVMERIVGRNQVKVSSEEISRKVGVFKKKKMEKMKIIDKE